jgi:hypothetical protein
MHRIKHPPLRNKINLTDSVQVRAWARRLGVSADELKAVVEKVGNSIAAVTKEIELERGKLHRNRPSVNLSHRALHDPKTAPPNVGRRLPYGIISCT